MQPNPDIYPSVYGATLTAESDRVEWSYPISHLNFLDKLPFEQPMDGSNSYIGFDPTINDCYVGAAKHTVMRINPEDKKQATIEDTTYKKKINYRLLMMESNSLLSSTPINATYPVAWTNIVSPWFSKFTESGQSITFYNVMSESSGTAALQSAALSTFGAYKSYIYAPITKINTDAILGIPQFRYINVTPTYDTLGNITGIRTTVSWIPFYRLKPQDKSAAGDLYDSELWENGFKDTIDSETGRITQRVVIAGARINDIYYGVNTRNAFNALSDSSWSDKNLRPSTSRVGLNILAEYYDEDRNSVIYEYPNGVFFSSGSDTIKNPATPWDQFYNTKLIAYARMNPNDCGYYSSSADNSGLMCNNDTNDLEKSNTVIFPSNFVSPEEDGNRFEIHNNINYYYFNSDGTVSYYSSYYSNNAQYYIYHVQTPCFPLKDLIATIASFGFFFSDGATSVNSYVLDDPTTYDSHLYRGKFDENGVSDGTWWQGDDIPDDKLEDIDYEPEVPGGGGGDTDEDEESGDRIPNQYRSFVGSNNFISQYALTAEQLQTFGKMLWTSWNDSQTVVDAINNFWIAWNIEEFTGSFDISSVMSFIVSLRVFPFNPVVSGLSNFILTDKLNIGRGIFPFLFPSQVGNIVKLLSTVIYVDCGTVTIPRRFGDFKDYNNMNITCFCPYCGTVELNPGDVIGRTLHARYAVDMQTGDCLCMITMEYNGSELYNVASIAGNMGANIPVSATNSGLIMARRLSDEANGIGLFGGMFTENVNMGAKQFANPYRQQSAIGAIAGAASTAMGNVFKDIQQVGQFATDMLSRGAISCPVMQGGEGFTSFAQADTPFIQMRYGIYAEPANYPHSVGRISTSSGAIGDYKGSGFITCENVDTTKLTCHNDEKAAIAAALETGVFV